MKLYGILGYPLTQSLSPAMHNAAFKALNIDASYEKFEILSENLEDFVQNKLRQDISGLSVTIPYKVEIMKYLDEIDEISTEIGAVNTVINEKGKLKGTNTDWYGALKLLENIINLENKNVILLGAGGAARAIAYGLNQSKANVIILVREIQKAQIFKDKYNFKIDKIENIFDYQTCDILINSTNVGMESNESLVPEKFFQKNIIVFDIVYKPLKTQMLKTAKNAGCKIITGDQMLLNQGIKQFELWTNTKAPIEIMRKAL
ncbi:shikimate dehydrogenase [Candidatus Peregrinibacteria bacterium RIFOXYC2_FULL_33_13]|nr:MAG: Shikimate dehydrogenase [Candidatus Peregrinibacteria bacterium GW2011_GWA2_33_10]KKP38475.1 MAG: shikimate 5-dehydrogenase, shikimate dehydrogenase [Candidatus Peregrinibacteria bacterium GW2011_GWC2_33_13]OGJ54191.1 MAG: shikimate dehydrogenase [Candidatus Peregrinibacteria bacterium RIFOXYC2_FULL_33_13]